MLRAARPRKLVRFAWELHHRRRHLSKLERSEHLLAACSGRRPHVGFALDWPQRRLDLVDIPDRLPFLEIYFFLPGCPAEQRRLEPREIDRVPEVPPVRDRSLGHRRLEAAGIPNGPVRQHATAAYARYAKLVRIHPAEFDQLSHSSHRILVIVSRIIELNPISEVLAIARASSRIRIHHSVVFRPHPLKSAGLRPVAISVNRIQ